MLRVVEFRNGTSWHWMKDYIYANGRHLGTVSAAEGERHFSLDHLGSIRLITNPQRTMVGYHAYYPFGEEAGTAWDGEVMKFTGHERDLHGTTAAMDDLDYMHARSYNPNLARFLTIDPGRDNDPFQPQSWNLYAYTRGNPMKYVDPDGRDIRMVFREPRGLHPGHIVLQVVTDGKVIATWSFAARRTVSRATLSGRFVPGVQTPDIDSYLQRHQNRSQDATLPRSLEVDQKLQAAIEARIAKDEQYALRQNNCATTAAELIGQVIPEMPQDAYYPKEVFEAFLKIIEEYHQRSQEEQGTVVRHTEAAPDRD